MLPAWTVAVARAYGRPVARMSARLFQTAQLSVITTRLASPGRNGWLTRTSKSRGVSGGVALSWTANAVTHPLVVAVTT
jgi:hypothetical protein